MRDADPGAGLGAAACYDVDGDVVGHGQRTLTGPTIDCRLGGYLGSGQVGALRQLPVVVAGHSKFAADVLEDSWRICATLGTAVGSQLRRQQFDRHSSVVGRRVVRAPHLAHAAAAQQLDKAITPERRALHRLTIRSQPLHRQAKQLLPLLLPARSVQAE
jgi:hypothetical protein